VILLVLIVTMTCIVFILLGVFVTTSIFALQWKQLVPSDLPDGPVGRTSPPMSARNAMVRVRT